MWAIRRVGSNDFRFFAFLSPMRDYLLSEDEEEIDALVRRSKRS